MEGAEIYTGTLTNELISPHLRVGKAISMPQLIFFF